MSQAPPILRSMSSKVLDFSTFCLKAFGKDKKEELGGETLRIVDTSRCHGNSKVKSLLPF